MSVLLETSAGDIVVDLYVKKRKLTSFNFLKLCKIKYYNYCLFHTIQKNYLIQTGDPTNTRHGGESIFKKIFNEDKFKYVKLEIKPIIKHSTRGLISFVNNGNDEFGSQFFLTTGEKLTYLDGKHIVFGTVTEGMDVLSKLNDVLCDENEQPYQDVWLNHTIILSDPFEDPPQMKYLMPDSSPLPTYDHIFSQRIAVDDELMKEKDEDIQITLEREKDKEARARAKILEIVGDLPSANIKPRENILFVCKLNPVTIARDLDIIFSRFGVIKSCDIVTDKLTGNSLGYGFIEYTNVEDCEQAILTMDNVLIDDRRIHVDFCQSVAKERRESYKKRRL